MSSASETTSLPSLDSLQKMANRLRKHSLLSTSEAGSGHPSSCFSCAEIVSTLFFQFLRFDVEDPSNPLNDRFILSKGHAAPILWAALAEAGAFPVTELLTLRKIDSLLEGHPTPRHPLIDVATGSLGQGLSAGVGMAIGSKRDNNENRIFVLMGDGETAEGSVWEAAALASHYELSNLVGIVDVNRLGQSQATMYEHDLETYSKRFEAFGWKSRVVDGHNISEVANALQAGIEQGGPTAIIARTLKGKGVSFMEDKDGWHGKPVPKGEMLELALAELNDEGAGGLTLARPSRSGSPTNGSDKMEVEAPRYSQDDKVATRKAYGSALSKLAAANPSIYALDGDTKNSTYSQALLETAPDRFVECFIAEQNMVGVACGLSALGKIPFASTFACFLTRAYDQIRMAAVSQLNLKLCGSHAGVSIGQDGPSQMGLEDLAMMRAIQGSTVLYPSDAVSAERLVALASQQAGIVYIRTSRPATAILYSDQESFAIGGSKTLRSSPADRLTIVSAGVTLHEALNAYDQLESEEIQVRVIDLYSLKPVDVATLQKAARETGQIITVEDHNSEGGVGDAVLSALSEEPCRIHKIAVNGLPRSGAPDALMSVFGIDAASIAKTVRRLLA